MGKKLDSFKKFCKLYISFFNFNSRISFEKIEWRSLINLILLNFWYFLIINIFFKSAIVISLLLIMFLFLEESNGKEAKKKTNSIENKINKRLLRKTDSKLYWFIALLHSYFFRILMKWESHSKEVRFNLSEKSDNKEVRFTQLIEKVIAICDQLVLLSWSRRFHVELCGELTWINSVN